VPAPAPDDEPDDEPVVPAWFSASNAACTRCLASAQLRGIAIIPERTTPPLLLALLLAPVLVSPLMLLPLLLLLPPAWPPKDIHDTDANGL